MCNLRYCVLFFLMFSISSCCVISALIDLDDSVQKMTAWGQKMTASVEFEQIRFSSLKLGQDKEYVLGLALPTQKNLPLDFSKQPEQFRNKNGELIEIYYMRSGWLASESVTDSFTPLTFTSGVLTSIGYLTPRREMSMFNGLL